MVREVVWEDGVGLETATADVIPNIHIEPSNDTCIQYEEPCLHTYLPRPASCRVRGLAICSCARWSSGLTIWLRIWLVLCALVPCRRRYGFEIHSDLNFNFPRKLHMWSGAYCSHEFDVCLMVVVSADPVKNIEELHYDVDELTSVLGARCEFSHLGSVSIFMILT